MSTGFEKKPPSFLSWNICALFSQPPTVAASRTAQIRANFDVALWRGNWRSPDEAMSLWLKMDFASSRWQGASAWTGNGYRVLPAQAFLTQRPLSSGCQ